MTAVGDRQVDLHNQRQRHYFETTDQRTLRPTGSRYLRRHVDRMVRFAAIQPGHKVLEVGCGLGRYTLLLDDLGVAVEGLDLSPALLEQMRQFMVGRREIPLHGFDLLDCPPEMDGTFDAVVGFMVLHHVHDVDACLAKAAALVKTGGRVAFLEPNPWNPLYYVQITLTPEMRWKHERGLLRMRPKVILPALVGAGLCEPSMERFGLFPPFVTNRRAGAAVEEAAERLPLGAPPRPFVLFGGTRAH